MATNNIRNVRLDKCYFKDAARYRKLADHASPPLSIRVWRERLAKLAQKGTDVYFVVVDGVDLGYVLTFNPFDSSDWSIVYFFCYLSESQSMECEVLHDINKEVVNTVKTSFAREVSQPDGVSSPLSGGVLSLVCEVSRQLFQMDQALYRMDVYYSESRKRQDQEDSAVCADGLSMLSIALKHRTFFSPELDDRQVAFIPWEFGYLAVVTNPRRDKVESIDFVRGHICDYDMLVRKAAYLNGLVDESGVVIADIIQEPSDLEADILTKARSELAKYLQHALSPEIEYDFPDGTPFQQSVWKEAAKIPLGSIKTYSDLAHLIEPDRKKAGRLARAVGQALSANPLPILIPCHRVIGANRNLVGFSGGVDIKEHLLQMELWKVGLKD